MLPGTSESFNEVRVAETVIRSPGASGFRMRVRLTMFEVADHFCSATAKAFAVARIVPLVSETAKENPPFAAEVTVRAECSDLSVTAAPEMTAPLMS